MKKRDMAVATHLLQKKVERLERSQLDLCEIQGKLEDILEELAVAHLEHQSKDVREYAGLLIQRFESDLGMDAEL